MRPGETPTVTQQESSRARIQIGLSPFPVPHGRGSLLLVLLHLTPPPPWRRGGGGGLCPPLHLHLGLAHQAGTKVHAPSPGLDRQETGSQDSGLQSTGPCEEVRELTGDMLSVIMSWLLLGGPRGEEMLSQLGASAAGLDHSGVLGRVLPAQERGGERAPGLQGTEGKIEQRHRPDPSSSRTPGGGSGPGGWPLLGTRKVTHFLCQGLADQELSSAFSNRGFL